MRKNHSTKPFKIFRTHKLKRDICKMENEKMKKKKKKKKE